MNTPTMAFTPFLLFDPLEAQLPIHRDCEMGDTLRTARAILKGRSRGQLDAMANLIGHLRGAQGLKHTERLSLSGQAWTVWPTVIATGDMHFGLDAFDILMECEAAIPLLKLPRLPKLQWYELFAALGIVCIAHAQYIEADMLPLDPHGQESLKASMLALDGMARTTMGYAERLVSQTKKIQSVSLSGVQARHADSNAFKAAVLALYEKKYRGKFSHRQAAKLISLELEASGDIEYGSGGLHLIFQGKQALCGDDHQNRIQKWIGAYVKNSTPT